MSHPCIFQYIHRVLGRRNDCTPEKACLVEVASQGQFGCAERLTSYVRSMFSGKKRANGLEKHRWTREKPRGKGPSTYT